jgi:hypothetical protein
MYWNSDYLLYKAPEEFLRRHMYWNYDYLIYKAPEEFLRSSGYSDGYGMDGQRSIPGRGKFFFSLQHPDWLWGPSSLLSRKYQGRFAQG